MTALRPVLAAAVLATFLSAPALPRAAAAPAPAAGPVVVAKGDYWKGFVDFWTDGLKKQNGVVLVALLVGVVAIFIITRGKWRK